MSISLENLPEVCFAEKDVEKIEMELLSDFEEISGRTLFPGDPLRILILGFSKYFALLRNNIDLSAKQNLLKYAGEDYIDNIGALVGVSRLGASSATVTMRFFISEAQDKAITIPQGTRVTCNNLIYFETAKSEDIEAGELFTDIEAICLETGTKGNGYYIGQINELVDPISFISKVCNTTVSAGGADVESLENFRERILIAPESFSVAGPKGAYIFLAKTASADIEDISVVSPEAGVVEIIPLLKNGEIPTSELLNKVKDICSDEEKRPLTDNVKVSAPKSKEYNINVLYYIDKEETTSGTEIQKNVDNAVDMFIKWQRAKLGRDINPSKLISDIILAGAKRVEVTEPSFEKLNYNQIAICKSINVVYGGLEDD